MVKKILIFYYQIHCDTIEELNEKEIYYIDLFCADLSDNFYNITKGGYKHEGCKGKNNGRYGKPVSQETRDKISKANKGKKRTEEQKKKLSQKLKGRKLNLSKEKRELKQQNFLGKNNPNYNNHTKVYEMTDEIKQKISKTKKQNWSIEKQFNFGKVSYTNPDTLETKYFIEGTQPKNWIKGNKKLSEHVNNKGKNRN